MKKLLCGAMLALSMMSATNVAIASETPDASAVGLARTNQKWCMKKAPDSSYEWKKTYDGMLKKTSASFEEIGVFYKAYNDYYIGEEAGGTLDLSYGWCMAEAKALQEKYLN